ncbi:hypothetical protein [Paludibaculum fermentans]|uniref:hypothetical protein n=1 Tax=Paludibaculum fermentans TaxID=1473598 RepID=UPI003EBFB13B
MVRVLLLLAVALLSGCGSPFEFNPSEMTPDQIVDRSSHLIIGVIEYQVLESWPLVRTPGERSKYWKILRRRVRVETVLRGTEDRRSVDIYEVYWVGGASGQWNSTRNGERCLFPLRVEHGRYHLTRDWLRSIYPINSGRHDRLPLDGSHPFGERFALLNNSVGPGWNSRLADWTADPFGALSQWRKVKLWRGLLKHPDRDVRLAVCESLLYFGWAQDECWDQFPEAERALLDRHHYIIPPERAWRENRQAESRMAARWAMNISRATIAPWQMDRLRLHTTVNSRPLRTRFCRDFLRRFPLD